jgi:archaellum component FlaC
MTPHEITIIFQSQTENVRELEKAWKLTNSIINEAYRTNDLSTATFQTRMLALIFCAYSEAMFSKLIHTPYGFSSGEIETIKSKAQHNIYQGWLECLSVVTNKINTTNEEYRSEIVKDVAEIIESYIKEPSEIRNKIAHGQWKVALNSKNTAINSDATAKVQAINIVDLTRYKSSFSKLSIIMEDLIESPNHAHWKFYDKNVTEYRSEQLRMANWALEDKINRLKPKNDHYRNKLREA